MQTLQENINIATKILLQLYVRGWLNLLLLPTTHSFLFTTFVWFWFIFNSKRYYFHNFIQNKNKFFNAKNIFFYKTKKINKHFHLLFSPNFSTVLSLPSAISLSRVPPSRLISPPPSLVAQPLRLLDRRFFQI